MSAEDAAAARKIRETEALGRQSAKVCALDKVKQ